MGATYWLTNNLYTRTLNCSVGQYSAVQYTQNMHVQWKIVTGNPQVMRKLTEFAKMCCTCNASLKLALQTSVMVVTFTLLAFNC